MPFTSHKPRSISTFLLIAGILVLCVTASRAEAKCAAWPGCLDKWQRQLAMVKGIHGKGRGVKIRSTGQTLIGQQLGAYIGLL